MHTIDNSGPEAAPIPVHHVPLCRTLEAVDSNAVEASRCPSPNIPLSVLTPMRVICTQDHAAKTLAC